MQINRALNPYLIPYIKMVTSTKMDHRPTCKNYERTSRKKHRRNPLWHSVRQRFFLDMTSKTLFIKEKTDKLDFHKIKI